MKVANKQRGWLLKTGEERQLKFYIRNDYAGPVEVEVSFAEQENAHSKPELPQRFVVAPGESETLFEVGGNFSHIDEQNRYAVDIAMPVGTPVYTAKSGLVMEIDNDFYKGGIDETYRSKANSIRILHDDGWRSMPIWRKIKPRFIRA